MMGHPMIVQLLALGVRFLASNVQLLTSMVGLRALVVWLLAPVGARSQTTAGSNPFTRCPALCESSSLRYLAPCAWALRCPTFSSHVTSTGWLVFYRFVWFVALPLSLRLRGRRRKKGEIGELLPLCCWVWENSLSCITKPIRRGR